MWWLDGVLLVMTGPLQLLSVVVRLVMDWWLGDFNWVSFNRMAQASEACYLLWFLPLDPLILCDLWLRFGFCFRHLIPCFWFIFLPQYLVLVLHFCHLSLVFIEKCHLVLLLVLVPVFCYKACLWEFLDLCFVIRLVHNLTNSYLLCILK